MGPGGEGWEHEGATRKVREDIWSKVKMEYCKLVRGEETCATVTECTQVGLKLIELDSILGDQESMMYQGLICEISKNVRVSAQGGTGQDQNVASRQERTPQVVYGQCGITGKDMKVMMLNKFNFKEWFGDLSVVLRMENCIQAIQHPLIEYDPINQYAVRKIRNSVPFELQHETVNEVVAYEMVRKLEAKYGTLDYDQSSAIESQIKSTKLEKLSPEEVDKHLAVVNKLMLQMKQGGAMIQQKKMCHLLAKTLPKPKPGEVEDKWGMLKQNLKQCPLSYEQAVENVRERARELYKKQQSVDFPQAAFQAENNRGAFRGRARGRSFAPNTGPRRPSGCHRCGLPDHGYEFCKVSTSDVAKLANKKDSSAYSYACGVTNPRVNYLDSGSTSHHKNTTDGFKDIRRSEVKVTTANGSVCKSVGIGDAVLRTNSGQFVLEDVCFTPDFESNLISVSKLTAGGHWVLFTESEALVCKSGDIRISGPVVFKVPQVDGLYQFQEPGRAFVSSSQDWHGRFGHPGQTKTSELRKLYPELQIESPSNCEPCILAKQRQKPYPKTSQEEVDPLEIVHLDICESKGSGYDGSRYFLVILDEHSKYLQVDPIKNKTAETVLEHFKRFQTVMERQLDKKVKKVRSDNGREFCGQFTSYLNELGIRHQTSVPYCHQQNGSAERVIQTVTTKARTMMVACSMPARFWPLAVKAAAFTYNLCPHSALEGKVSPFKCLFPRTKDIVERGKGLHVFGSVAYRWIHKERRDLQTTSKFEKVSEELIFVGYESLDNDAFTLLNPLTSAITKERNVKIVDNQFPFKKRDRQTEREQVLPDLFVTVENTLPESGGEDVYQEADRGESQPPEAEQSPVPEEVTPEQESDYITWDVTETSSSGETERNEQPRRSARTTRQPDRLAYNRRGEQSNMLVTANLALNEEQQERVNEFGEAPKTFCQAMKSPIADICKLAADEEMAALMTTHTFDEVESEPGMEILPTKIVLTVKRKPGGPIDVVKARIVVLGNLQKEGVDFWEIFAPTAPATSIRLFLTVCLTLKMKIHQVDVCNAFLNGDIDGAVYVRPPEPYHSPGKVWLLKKALYGLKQSPRCWAKKLKEIMAKMGFFPTESDSCVFVKKEEDDISYILAFVDDILIGAKDEAKVKQIKSDMMSLVRIRDLGEIGTFLGVNCTPNKDGSLLELSQEHYIDKLVEKFDLEREKPVHKLPQLHAIDLNDGQVDESIPLRSIIGALLYISHWTRPDISTACSILAQHQLKPTKVVWTYAKKVLKYLQMTKHKRLVLGNLDGSNLVGYADANFSPPPDRISQSGAVFKLGGSTVGWTSRKQKSGPVRSTAAAEYIALSDAVQEIQGMQQLMEEMMFPVVYPTRVYEDNQPALKVATSQTNAEMTKSIDIRYHVVRHLVATGVVEVKYIRSEDQLADALTKVPASEKIIDALLGPQSQRTGPNRGVCCEEIGASPLDTGQVETGTMVANNERRMFHPRTFYARRGPT